MIEQNLGTLLRRLRKEAGLTQEVLAERALLSVRTVSDIEAGAQRRPRADTLEAIAEALALDTDARSRLYASVPRADSARPNYAVAVPEPPAPLIGRERDVAAVVDLLKNPALRLLTLTGLGGVGKTSLAFESARAFAGQTGARAVLAELAAVDVPELVLPVIGQSLAQQSGSDFVETIASAIGSKPTLVVVDNVEHVRAAAADLSRLIAAIPSLTILATSRFALGLRIERVYPVAPLRIEDAATLFIERVRTSFPAFEADAADPAIREIAERLDRLPLAIELAAPRVKVLGTAGLFDELSVRLPLLSSQDADRPRRQRTLRDTIAWSYDLMSDEDRSFFRHASVFRGGFRIEGAKRVTSADVIDRIESLLDKHLLRRCEREGEPPRFGMLETIAEFARERAREAGEWDELCALHAGFMAELAEEWEDELRTLPNDPALRALDEEIDNVRAALMWCSETNDVATGLRIASSLWRYWLVRDMPEEARYQLHTLIGRYENGADVAAHITAKAYCNAASFELAADGDRELVKSYATTSAQMYRELGDPAHAERIEQLVEAL